MVLVNLKTLYQSVKGLHLLKIVPNLSIHSMPEKGGGDLIGGSKNSYIATFVERQSCYVMLVKVANKRHRKRHVGAH
jgi:hypothetical protein